jgi:hypothetical protein
VKGKFELIRNRVKNFIIPLQHGKVGDGIIRLQEKLNAKIESYTIDQ